MSDAARIAFGLCGLIGGTAGLVGAYLVWKTGRHSIDDLKKRLDLHKAP
ncbi:hypothetical protein [Streptomyces sp. NPDC058202]